MFLYCFLLFSIVLCEFDEKHIYFMIFLGVRLFPKLLILFFDKNGGGTNVLAKSPQRPLHDPCTTLARPAHYPCTTLARLFVFLFPKKSPALPLHYPCTTLARPLHYPCTTLARLFVFVLQK
jgi:hypothetical protein